MKTKIGLVDDHTILREGVIKILNEAGNVEVIHHVGSMKESHLMLDKYPAMDILLCDINLPDGNGYEILSYIKEYNYKPKVIFLTMHDKSSMATKAIELGAMGYLTKDAVKAELLNAIETVSVGKKYFGHNIMQNIVENMNKPQEGKEYFKKILSKREYQVLDLIVEGQDTKEIADQLHISEKTASNYRISIMQKCNVKNLVQLLKLYLRYV
ncbi:MAG: response regulator transcription factor [Cyclobacteriaceae bacterium]